ncbi:MAG: protein kinase, partial [Candidatus Solibacter usitatus]|nr:protein kinase [Candidatus Solibacter usitatus]
ILGEVISPAVSRFQGWELGVACLASCLIVFDLTLFYHFLYRFPAGVSRAAFWTAGQYLLYTACGILTVGRVVWSLTYLLRLDLLIDQLSRSPGAVQWTAFVNGPFSQADIAAGALLCCGVVIRNYRRVRESDHRRRIKWICFGALAGVFPALVINVLLLIPQPIPNLMLWREISLAWLAVIPISVAYAVVKERVFGIDVVIRRGLQYVLAANVLRGVMLLPALAFLVSVLRNPNRTVAQILTEGSGWFNLLLIAAAFLSLKYRKQVQVWLDRRFFREAYDQERILRELIEEIKKLDSIPEIARLVSRRVDAALHPASIQVFYREREKSDLLVSHLSSQTNVPASENLPIPSDHPLLRRVEGGRIADHEGKLVAPIVSAGEQVIGLLLLGERKSEEPYSANDRNLLRAIASQMGVVYENLYLKERVGQEERIKRDVLARLDNQSISLLKECPKCGACYDSWSTTCGHDGETLTMTLPVERTIEGKYRLDRLIGKGGMGAVYEAADLRLSRKVAVKVLMGSLFGNQKALRRFSREARAAARLDSLYITRVFDFGTIGSEGAYLVMEMLRGTTWRVELRREGSIAPERAAEWFDQLLQGMQAAHQAGVVHRDLKPENVAITQTEGGAEIVKILDFGLAKLQRRDDSEMTANLTAVGTVIGTYGYMAPEQLLGGEADQRSDIFSLGVMAAETVTGQKPFAGRTPRDFLAALLHDSFRPTGVADLDAVLARCLTKDRAARFESVGELRAALIPVLRACPARPATPPVAHDPSAPTMG